MLLVTDHAVERFRIHYPRANHDWVIMALDKATEIDPGVVQALLQRFKPPSPQDSYWLPEDCRGLFVVVANKTVRTYLRFCPSQQEFCRKNYCEVEAAKKAQAEARKLTEVEAQRAADEAEAKAAKKAKAEAKAKAKAALLFQTIPRTNITWCSLTVEPSLGGSKRTRWSQLIAGRVVSTTFCKKSWDTTHIFDNDLKVTGTPQQGYILEAA